jgi:DNA-binding response OmpR family regulator
VPYPWKILIVDDEETFADNLRSYCSRSGCDSWVVGTGKLAVAAATEFLPELILLDYRLPDMDGFDVLAAIRARHHFCNCVLMTGHPADMIRAGAERHKIVRILYKPFSLAELEAALLLTLTGFCAVPTGAAPAQ